LTRGARAVGLRAMELLTLKPLRHQDTIEIEVVALDDSGVTLTCMAQLTKDLSDIHTLAWDNQTTVTEELLAFVRSEVSDYLKANQAKLAGMVQ
jgi:hypothetical protein